MCVVSSCNHITCKYVRRELSLHNNAQRKFLKKEFTILMLWIDIVKLGYWAQYLYDEYFQ